MAIQQSAEDPVVVEVDTATGRFSYSRDPIFLTRGETVSWRFDQGPWVVMPFPVSPLDGTLQVHGGGGEEAGAQIRADIPLGKYRYFVAVLVDGRLWADDPEFMIEA